MDKTSYTGCDLQQAAAEGNTKLCSSILKYGIDVNYVKDHNDFSPLMFAAAEGHCETVQLLLDMGAKINFHDIIGRNALMLCIYTNEIETFKILLEKGADVNHTDCFDVTILMTAAECSRVDMCTLLLDRGADINYESPEGETVLNHSVYSGSIEIFQLLFEKGAELKNVIDRRGETVLHRACRYGYLELAKKITEIIDREHVLHLNVKRKSALQVWGLREDTYTEKEVVGDPDKEAFDAYINALNSDVL